METQKRKAIFLDRDGIINKARMENNKPCSPRKLSELELVDGIIGVCRKLKAAGYLLLVVTNQPEVSRGRQTQHQVEEMHDWLKTMLPIDAFYVCYHDDDDRCICRKPKPGMFIKARNVWKLDMSQCYLVGDSWKDIAAAARADCKTIFVDYSYVGATPCVSDFTCKSIEEATQWLLDQ